MMVSSAWREYALPLARWAITCLVVRHDVWGAYGREGGTYTAPAGVRRGRNKLNLNLLVAHFLGCCVIGVHTIAPDEYCRWVGFDIDRHADEINAGDNWETALAVAHQLRDIDVEPIIEDSDGNGGYHIWVLFTEPFPAELAFRVSQWIKKQTGAPDIESFPKQPRLSGKRCGSWLRLPGKHHRRDHWSRFYDLDSEQWLEGEAAVRLLLSAPVNDVESLERLRPILPSLPQPSEAPAVVVGGDPPACIRDLLQNNIRQPGDRNKALLSLCRYWKATGVPESQAVIQGTAFARAVPPGLTTSTLTDEEKAENVRSVASAVYAGSYPFACSYLRSHGTPERPIACDGWSCTFVDRRVPLKETTGPARVPTINDQMITPEVPLVC